MDHRLVNMSSPTMKGFYKCKHPEKYLGNPTNIVYRSSYELKYMIYLDNAQEIVGWKSEETIVVYKSPIDGKVHRYFLDFYIEKMVAGQKKRYIIEIKPYTQTLPPKKPASGVISTRFMKEAATFAVNQAKWEAARKWGQQRGIEFQILTEADLGIHRPEKVAKRPSRRR